MSKVLYIGSGKSALQAKEKDLSDYIVVCVNNSWRIFENSTFDYWIHPGDFPKENYPTTMNYKYEISYKDYSLSAKNIVKKLNIKTNSPEHYLGYTTFFNGLYWIMDFLKPEEIHTLGFDHDYNQQKVEVWKQNGSPNPQNNFLKKKGETIKEWSDNFFKGMEQDFFYGHGTPDPLRLGDNHLLEKFKQALNFANVLGIRLYNLSNVDSKINIFPKLKNEKIHQIN